MRTKNKIIIFACQLLALIFCAFALLICGCADDGQSDEGLGNSPSGEVKPTIKEKDDVNTKYMDFFDGFKIMILADIQVDNKFDCDRSFIEITKLVESELPDLIILTGDNIFRPNDTSLVDALINNMEALNTPWAPVFGNHDAEGKVTKAQMGAMFMSAPNCLFLPGEEFIHDGGDDCLGNYCVNLRSRGKTVYSLFLMDTNMDAPAPEKGYCYLYPDQIEWFSERAENLQKGREDDPVNIFAFFHIPVPEYKDAVEQFKTDSSIGWGTFKEDVCCSVKNTGFFEAAKKVNTKAIFCGHDHNNTGALLYDGVQLAYGLKSSAYSYHDDEMLGATVITLKKNSFDIENVHFN